MEIKQIKNLDNNVYHNSEEYSEHWSSSNIKKYLETPKEAYYQKYTKEQGKQAEALVFGNQLHDLLASKHVNGQLFEYNTFEPPINPKTGKYYGKETKAYQMELDQIINPISADTMQLIDDIWFMIKGSDCAWYIFEKILKQGVAEPSFFVESLKGFHKYKYRPDVLTDTAIYDWKSVAKNYWSEKALKYRVTDLGYDISAAMYQFFEHQRTGVWKPFIIIWIMKDPPFDILIDDISKFAYEPIGNNEVIAHSGAIAFNKLKDQHELCQTMGKWPGLANQYDRFGGVRMADYLPSSFQERNYNQFDVDVDKF